MGWTAQTLKSRRIMLQMAVAMIGLFVMIGWQWPVIATLYWGPNSTPMGTVINTALGGLLMAGVLQLQWLLWTTHREETSVAVCAANLHRDDCHPMTNVDPDSLIHRRYTTLATFRDEGASIPAQALASIQLAGRAHLFSFPRFLNNTFILLGMFGTIVSLAIALAGASDLLRTLVQADSMGTIVAGMSTALSTTMTAITCYVFFHYFYQRALDCQTMLLHEIERLSTVYFVPKFSSSLSQVEHRLVKLLEDLQNVVASMSQTQARMDVTVQSLQAGVVRSTGDMHAFSSQIAAINRNLVAGFRLEEPRH